MRKYILSAAAIALMLGLLLQALPGSAQEPQLQEAPKLAVPAKSPPIINGHGTGGIPPAIDLSHLTGQRMPSEVLSAGGVFVPPASFDWRTLNKVTSVKEQGACGSCYAFASIGNIESKLLIDGAGTYDFSENNAKECNWYDTSCVGGSCFQMTSWFSKKGTVLESCDPYVASDVSCKATCPYQITLLDWRIICGNVVPDTNVLKTYIQTYGPVYTMIYSGFPGFGTYDGSYTLYYEGTEAQDHYVLIVGWNDSLVHAGGSGGWIVKNSWGTDWGGTCGYGTEKGYFTIAYGSANIGKYSSFMYDWQSYDSSGGIMFYDEAGWTTMWGDESTTLWGLCKFIPSSNTYVTRVEFWTTDETTDIDVYIYDGFNGTTVSNLLAQKLNNSFSEAGYHSVELDSPLPVTIGNDVIAVVKFTNSSFVYPVAVDDQGPSETARTYISSTGASGSWTDMGSYDDDDVAIRLRTSTPEVGAVEVSINAPTDDVPENSNFTATVDISQVENLDTAGYDVVFDDTVLRLDDVTNGTIDGTVIPVGAWNLVDGRVTIVQNVPGLAGVTGSGTLAVLHFHVIGTAGDESAIDLQNGFLGDNTPAEIEATWIGDSVHVVTSAVLPGDANGDGVVNNLDITKVERIIVGLDAETPGADANQDGVVNNLDITKVERIIVGLD